MAFRFDKFTIKAQESVQRAVDLAADRGNPQTTPVHLLSALVAEQGRHCPSVAGKNWC